MGLADSLLKRGSDPDLTARMVGSCIEGCNYPKAMKWTMQKINCYKCQIFEAHNDHPTTIGFKSHIPSSPDTAYITNKINPVGGCKTNAHFNVTGSLEIVKSVIPDSLEDEQTGCDATNQRPLHFNLVQADYTLFDKKIRSADVLGLCGNADGGKGFSNIYCENGGYKGIIHEEVEMLLEKGENLISDSPIHCTPPNKQMPSEEETDDESTMGVENALHTEVQTVNLANSFPDNPGFRSQKLTISSNLVPFCPNTEWLEQGCPSSIKSLGTVDGEVLETHHGHDSPGTDAKAILDQHHLENSVDKLPLITDTSNGENEDRVGNTDVPQMRLTGETAVVDAAASTCYYSLSPHPSRKYNGPLSESIICRNIKENGNLETFSAMGPTETNQVIAADNYTSHKTLLANECLFNAAPVACHNHARDTQAAEDIRSQNACDHSVPYVKGHQVDAVVNELVGSYKSTEVNNTAPCSQKQGMFLSGPKGSVNEAKLGSTDLLSDSKLQQKNMGLDRSFQEVPKPSNELVGFLELVGCYEHPTPVLSILLRRKGDDIQICVLCGCLEDNNGSLFIYKLSKKAEEEDYPSFLGYSSIMLPPSKPPCYRDVILIIPYSHYIVKMMHYHEVHHTAFGFLHVT